MFRAPNDTVSDIILPQGPIPFRAPCPRYHPTASDALPRVCGAGTSLDSRGPRLPVPVTRITSFVKNPTKAE